MLYYIDSSGVVQAAIPDTITQGAINVNDIVIIAPFPISTVVTATITLPNGMKIYPRYVGYEEIQGSDYAYKFAPVTAFEGKIPVPDGVTVNVWKMTLDRALTQKAGALRLTFLFTDASGHTLPSTEVTMNIGKATPFLLPTITNDDINLIATYVAAAQQSAFEAGESEEQAQQSADEAQEAADEAQEAAQDALAYLNELKNTLLYFNNVVTDLDDLSEVASTASGRVLVRGVEFTRDETFTFNPSISLVEFVECSVPVNALSLTFRTSGTCAIRGAAFALGEGVYTGTWNFNRFTAVEKCGRSGYVNCYYSNCTNITDCVISDAVDCGFIDNCVMYSESDAQLISCRFINGIDENDAFGSQGVTLRGCSYISNVNAAGRYESCTYVDAETCKGFISNADVGKVRTLTADGSYVSSDFATPTYVDEKIITVNEQIGDISTALDSLHDYALSLIDGGTV